MPRQRPLGYYKLEDLDTAKRLPTLIPTGIPAGAEAVLLQAEGQPIRWTDDGTDPTDELGQLLAAGDSMLYDKDLTALKLIETAATATVNASFYTS